MSTPDPPRRLVVLAPNWLGDAVMALPLVADLRRAWPATHIAMAARRSVAPLYALIPGVDATLKFETTGVRTPAAMSADAQRLRDGGFDAALLLPNSFLAAWLAWRAGIPARWGFARDLRGPLLTIRIPRMRRYGHQVEYYQAIGEALGVTPGPPHATVHVPETARQHAAALLKGAGLEEGRPYVVFAPGAAYGLAKQWPPIRYAELAQRLAGDHIATVLVGAAGDVPACRDIARMTPVVDLAGRTDLPTLAGLLTAAAGVVANDSGAMHLAAAVGARVTAIFGPTNEQKTSPLTAGPDRPAPRLVTAEAWCRPCMLRECPIDHRCMTRITAARVFDIIRSTAA